MACCTNTYDLGCYNFCSVISFGESPVNGLVTGVFTSGNLTIKLTISATIGDPFVFDLSYLNEDANYSLQLFDADNNLISATIDSVQYDCFSLKTKIDGVVVNQGVVTNCTFMCEEIYDPTGVNGDVFDYNNMHTKAVADGITITGDGSTGNPFIATGSGVDLGNFAFNGSTFYNTDNTQQIIYTGATPDVTNPYSQRLIIQGTQGFANSSIAGEGGDLYVWAGHGGYFNDGITEVGGDGGDIKLRGGIGYVGSNGGYLRMQGGDANGLGTGGFVELESGSSSTGNGGDVTIRANYGGANGGNVYVRTNGNTYAWDFGNDGVLDLPSTIGDIYRDGVSVLAQADWNQADNTQFDYIKNKPTIPNAQIQSDWTQSNISAVDYIKNKPTIPASVTNTSQLINDGEDGINPFITANDLPALGGYVPYTGATNSVDLGTYNLTADHIALNVSPSGGGFVEGATQWNNTIGSSETLLKGGNVALKNGVDLVARVVNKVVPNTTLTKANYQVVKVSGASGQRLAVDLAQANTDLNSADTLGIAIETIATNQEGFIMAVGQIEDINTTGSLQGETWADGDVLYLSPTTAGKITNIKPTGATGHIVVLGYVEYKHAVHGKIYVKIMNGWELDELHNVYINGVVNGDVLTYDSATSLWKNKQTNILELQIFS